MPYFYRFDGTVPEMKFSRFHGDKLVKGQRVILRFQNILTTKFPKVCPEAVRLRTFIREAFE